MTLILSFRASAVELSEFFLRANLFHTGYCCQYEIKLCLNCLFHYVVLQGLIILCAKFHTNPLRREEVKYRVTSPIYIIGL